MRAKFRIGDKVEVINPCQTSANKKGDTGKIVKIESIRLKDFGDCIGYLIENDNKDACVGTWEHESGLKFLGREISYEELLAQSDELVEALKELYNSCNPTDVTKNKKFHSLNLGENYVGSVSFPSSEAIHKAKDLLTKINQKP